MGRVLPGVAFPFESLLVSSEARVRKRGHHILWVMWWVMERRHHGRLIHCFAFCDVLPRGVLLELVHFFFDLSQVGAFEVFFV